MRDPYEVLEVERGASPKELKSAYRRLARQWHPDRNGAPEAEARFKELASAWEILGDPDRRRRFELREGRAARGELPEDFLDAVGDAIERAERWIRDGVLPHYARFWRGYGAEVAARLLAELESLVNPSRLRPGPWWKRWALASALDGVVVTVWFERHRQASVVVRGRGFTEIAILPQVLWDAGLRESSELDDAVMRLLIARYAQVIAAGHLRGQLAPDELVAVARRVDDALVWKRRARALGWGLLAAVIGFMLLAGYNQW